MQQKYQEAHAVWTTIMQISIIRNLKIKNNNHSRSQKPTLEFDAVICLLKNSHNLNN